MALTPYSKYDPWTGIVPTEKTTWTPWEGEPYTTQYNFAAHMGANWLDGYKLDRHREAIAQHVSATTPLEAMQDKLIQSAGYVSKQYVIEDGYPKLGPQYVEFTGHIRDYNWYDPDWLAAWSTEADNEAKRRFVNQIRSAQTTFQGGTFVAELAKAIALIKNPARTLRTYFHRGLRKVKKVNLTRGLGRRPPKVKLRQAIADTWLEIQFGALPLINDVDAAIQAIAESGVLVNDQYVSCVGVGEKEVVKHSGPYYIGFTPPFINFMMKKHERIYVRYLGQVDAGTYAIENMRTGFDPSNWAPTAWEIVPWSFLIDYFTNIGDIISAASLAKSGLVWVNRTEVREYTWEAYNAIPTFVNEQTEGSYSFANAFTPPVFSHKRKKVYRADWLNQSLVPTLEFSIPGTGTKWLNIAALVAGRREMRDLIKW